MTQSEFRASLLAAIELHPERLIELCLQHLTMAECFEVGRALIEQPKLVMEFVDTAHDHGGEDGICRHFLDVARKVGKAGEA